MCRAGARRRALWPGIVVAVLGVLLAAVPGPALAAGPVPSVSGPGAALRLAAVEPPDVVGLPLEEARTRLAQEWYPDRRGAYELVVRAQPDPPAEVPPEDVLVVAQEVRQYLEDSDDVRPTAAILLTVGSAVPDLLTRSAEEAEELLGLLGLGIKASGEGSVVRQSAAAGSLLPFGSVVAVRLEPTAEETRVVPDLGGLTRAQARAAVEQVELTLEVEAESGDGERTVRAQGPPGGTLLPPGGAVRVTLVGDDSPVTTVLVPDVTGLEPEPAGRVLDAAGLTLATDPDDVGAGSVAFRQDPLAGSRVDPGSVVSVSFAAVLEEERVSWLPWVGGGVVVLVVLGLALLLRPGPGGRGGRGATPAPSRVTVQPRPDGTPRVTTSSSRPAADVAVRVVATPDAGTLVLEEDPG